MVNIPAHTFYNLLSVEIVEIYFNVACGKEKIHSIAMMNLFTVCSIDVVCILWIIFHLRPKESIYKCL